MNYESANILALMSGTSCDGIDLAYISLELQQGKWNYKINISETIPYTHFWQQWLPTAHRLPREEVEYINPKYTKYLAETINYFIKKHCLRAIDFIASHGHTIFHQPENGYTLQIGNLPELAEWTQLLTVCDFRVEDVQLRGQGAPLVPIGDRLLFSDYTACINLGGFANISYEMGQQRIAYDICPVNSVLNLIAQKLGQAYDAEGRWAAQGKVSLALLKKLNSLEFYLQTPPKSLGIEWVNQQITPLLEHSDLSEKDKLATFTQHSATQIAAVLNKLPQGKCLFTGGGTYNTHLIKLIKSQTNQALCIPDEQLINYKEALIFGLLGLLKLRGEINVLHSVTGAKHDHSAGLIYYPSTRF